MSTVAESDQLTLIIGKRTAVCMKIHAQTAQLSTSAVVCGELGYLLESADRTSFVRFPNGLTAIIAGG